MCVKLHTMWVVGGSPCGHRLTKCTARNTLNPQVLNRSAGLKRRTFTNLVCRATLNHHLTSSHYDALGAYDVACHRRLPRFSRPAFFHMASFWLLPPNRHPASF